MKETTPAAMPPCFDRWCKRFDDLWTHIAQKREFRNYVGGLLGESERKNLSQMASNAVGVTYHRLKALWEVVRLSTLLSTCIQSEIVISEDKES
jgi:hypothetical protein